MTVTNDLVLIPHDVDNAPRWQPGERLHQVFEATVDRLAASGHDGRAAIDPAEGSQVSYAELDRQSNQLAHLLAARGVGPGDRIGLIFDDPAAAYPALLAVHKAGAAYVPLDPGFPADRIGYILQDAAVSLVLTRSTLSPLLSNLGVSILELDRLGDELAEQPSRRPQLSFVEDDLAYVIYTSGSTGRPKGVAVGHSSIVNFVRVAGAEYGLRETDRMYQGLTLAFDFSVEEIWVAWTVGATLVPRPGGSSLLGEDLHAFLISNQVTAMACVPTLLATLPADVPQLRYLVVSGEACPADLVVRWWRADRRFLNVYGPTETTVTSTWSTLSPDEPVTIGVPLPTYSCLVMDPDTGRLLGPGEPGELVVGGIGVAIGYLNRDDLTSAAFVPDPVGLANNPGGRVYRTGDLVRVLPDGLIEYLGRIDLQVKVRGYRIELTEIESVLMEAPGVAQAVVTTHAVGDVVELAAFLTRRPDADLDLDDVLAHARERLPSYMVPAYLDELDTIPLLPSDKADRSKLPAPGARRASTRELVAPRTPAEELLAHELAEVLGLPAVGATDHLFNDLAATSLLLARFCSRLRRLDQLPALSMREVYLNPSVERLAAMLTAAAPQTDWAALTRTAQAAAPASVPAAAPTTHPPAAPDRHRRFVLTGIAQAASLALAPLLLAVVMVPASVLLDGATSPLDLYLRAVLAAAAALLATEVVSVGGKWLLVGRLRPGSIRLWSIAHFRFWLASRLVQISPLAWLHGSPLQVWHLRLCGAKVGPGAIWLAHFPACPDMIELGSQALVGRESEITGYRADGDRLRFAPISIGDGAIVGDKCLLDIATAVGPDARLATSSTLAVGQQVPAGESWHGNPGRPLTEPLPALPHLPRRPGRDRRYAALQLLGQVAVGGALLMIASTVVEDMILSPQLPGPLADLDPTDPAALVAPVFLLSIVVVSGIAVLAFHLLALIAAVVASKVAAIAVPQGRTIPLHGWRWAVHLAARVLTNNALHMKLFGDSSVILEYLAAIGWGVDRHDDTGSNFGQQQRHDAPYDVRIGAGTMVSDGLTVLDAQISPTAFRLNPVEIGERCFLGNHIGWPAGARVGDDCLLGTKVAVPLTGPIRTGVGLLGSPAFEIPRSVTRDTRPALSDEERTERLRLKLRHNLGTMARLLGLEWLEITLFLFFARAAMLATGLDPLIQTWLALLLGAGASLATVILAERAVLGFRRLRPMSCLVLDPAFWRHERFWKLSVETHLKVFFGTAMLPTLWRLLGARIGEDVFDDGCSIPERSLVEIGDGACLNHATSIQAHSLEDGAFQSEPVVIGAGVVLAPGAYIHFGTRLGDGCVIETDAFLMKGEEVPANAVWAGNPAQPVPRTVPELAAGREPAWAWADGLSVHSVPQAGAEVAVLELHRAGLASAGHLADLERGGVPLHNLDPVELAEFGRLPGPRAVRSALARVLVRQLLAERSDAAPRQATIVREARGRLRVTGGTRLWVSVSHSPDVIAVAVADRPIGVDVETDRIADPQELADNPQLFTAAERRRLSQACDPSAALAEHWTLKEAAAKALGTGSLVDLSRLEVRERPGMTPTVTLTGHGERSGASWSRRTRTDVIAVVAAPLAG